MNEPNQTTVEVPEGIKISRAAFLRDFPALLADRKTAGKYICYRKDELVAIAKKYRTLVEEIYQRGYPEDEWLIFEVVPSAGREEQAFADEAEFNPD